MFVYTDRSTLRTSETVWVWVKSRTFGNNTRTHLVVGKY